jgi:HD-like signal output (HDOD) protein
LREVNRIVGMTVTGQLFSSALPLYRQQGDMMWQNSLATALAMAQLARTGGEDDRQAYTLGLLRPVGRVALQRMAMTVGAVVAPMPPDTAAAAQVLAWERTHFGLTNAETSAFLLAEWGFASPLCLAVKQHVQPVGAARPSRWAALLHVASWVADQLGKGLTGEKQFWSQDETVLREAGLPAKAPENCMMETREELNRLSSMVRAFGA